MTENQKKIEKILLQAIENASNERRLNPTTGYKEQSDRTVAIEDYNTFVRAAKH